MIAETVLLPAAKGRRYGGPPTGGPLEALTTEADISIYFAGFTMAAKKIINPIPPPAADASARTRIVQAGLASDVNYLPEESKINKPLIIFIGGYGDAATKRFYNTALQYREGVADDPDFQTAKARLTEAGLAAGQGAGAYQDIYYRPHDTRTNILLLMALYRAAGQKIALIGHSWGGATAYKLVKRFAAPVELLVTLDPVSVFPLGERPKPGNVSRWVNAYLDYKRADMSNSSNRTAWIGRHWGPRVKADVNYDFMSLWPGEGLPGHAWCYEMFNLFARREVELIR